ncbi:hydroxyisourate hydrolase [Paenibacillus chartarius]|uniref:5-hydroxyisourate hydrolase n=1 Tax=Paenibacillus chartarius TaxID=747481 RepID=A0ABV6DH42_9BACL
MMTRLTTHVLDISRGVPAAGVNVQLWHLRESPVLVAEAVTNADGRLDQPLLDGDADAGVYELMFAVRDYFRKQPDGPTDKLAAEPTAGGWAFLEQVPVRFRLGNADSESHYHIPLLVAPGGYSTYRGS